MPLADAISTVAQDIAETLNELPKGEDQSAQAWEVVLTKIAAWVSTSGVVTIPAGAIATAGSATNQVGPPAPVPIVGGIT